MLSVNLTSAFLCSKAVLPHMKKRKFGRLVHISSVGAFVGSITGHVGYGVSKAGVIALSKYLAKQFASDGILSNAIAPGSIDTPLAEAFGEENRQRLRRAVAGEAPGDPSGNRRGGPVPGGSPFRLHDRGDHACERRLAADLTSARRAAESVEG
ncbi:3-oxoacyl-[acyl-carrier-protein] reductase FabG [Geodia barretti]|nr:3-oxoacyl-[acyl-carrier-protein] reductase FabG [Geodia barretti]